MNQKSRQAPILKRRISSQVQRDSVVGPAGIEPATLGLEIRCSIRLSYGPAHNQSSIHFRIRTVSERELGSLGRGLVLIVTILSRNVVFWNLVGSDFGDVGVGHVFDALDDLGFECVALLDQLFDALGIGIGQI